MRFPLLAALAAAFLLPAPAWGQGSERVCNQRDRLLADLARQYDEHPVAVGLSGQQLVELLRSEDGGTWTLIVTGHNGISCLIAAGQGWRAVEPPGDPGA